MKELSVEEKAKRYDDLLVRLQEAKVDNDVCDDRYCCVIDVIVPELKESEGELAWLKRFIQEEIDCLSFDIRDSEDRVKLKNLQRSIAWLEKQSEQKSTNEIAKEVCKNKTSAVAFLKSAGIMNEKGELAEQYRQGEQKSIDDLTQQEAMDIAVAKCFVQGEQQPTDKVEPKFKVGDIIKNKKNGDTVKVEQILSDSYCYSGWDGAATIHSDFLISDQDNWELVEQKTAWSEEDENHVKSILSTIECCKAQFPNAQAVVEAYNADIEWLKSLKECVQLQPPNQWKPSEEQVGTLKEAIIYIESCESNFKGNGHILETLLEQLKKLREK